LLSEIQYEALYQKEEKALFNTVYRWVWDEQEAMDLVQEAFVKLWAVRQDVHPEQARAYTYRIALNLAANRRRAHKLWRMVGLEGRVFAASGPESSLIQSQSEQALRKAIDGLSEKYRRVLLLCRFSDMNHREIGKLLKIPQGTVASRHNKALQLLKDRLVR
jgi:RNA polymerase sigma-70 factor (ECF subfamily)